MKTFLLKQARAAIKDSLTEGKLDTKKIRDQIEWIKTKRLSQRLSLLRAYHKLLEEKQEESRVHIESSVGLSDSEKSSLFTLAKNLFGNKEIIFETDPTLLGGLKVINKDDIYDYSVQEKLNKIKEIFN